MIEFRFCGFSCFCRCSTAKLAEKMWIILFNDNSLNLFSTPRPFFHLFFVNFNLHNCNRFMQSCRSIQILDEFKLDCILFAVAPTHTHTINLFLSWLYWSSAWPFCSSTFCLQCIHTQCTLFNSVHTIELMV